MQTVVGLLCVALGCLHFADRERTPQERSFYIGTVRTSHTMRSVLALIEVTFGFVLLFSA